MKLLLLAAAITVATLSVPAIAQPDPASIIAQGDTNGDKALDKAEWDAMGIPFPFPVEGDTNKDGKIDAAELEVLFQQGPPGGGAPPAAAAPPAR